MQSTVLRIIHPMFTYPNCEAVAPPAPLPPLVRNFFLIAGSLRCSLEHLVFLPNLRSTRKGLSRFMRPLPPERASGALCAHYHLRGWTLGHLASLPSLKPGWVVGFITSRALCTLRFMRPIPPERAACALCAHHQFCGWTLGHLACLLSLKPGWVGGFSANRTLCALYCRTCNGCRQRILNCRPHLSAPRQPGGTDLCQVATPFGPASTTRSRSEDVTLREALLYHVMASTTIPAADSWRLERRHPPYAGVTLESLL